MKDQLDSIEREIFRDGFATFAVLDGASIPGLLDKLREWQPECKCLYQGDLKPDLAEVAPYLVRVEPGTDFTEWVISNGWGKHWGIFAIADADMQAMRHHFRRFLTVHDESGKPLLFRYYDPRVLRVYLPTCNAAELAEFFGPLVCYVMEGAETEKIVRFALAGGSLTAQETRLD